MPQFSAHQNGRTVHDADSHIIEYPGWLESYSSKYVRENLDPGLIPLDMPELVAVYDRARDRLAGNDPKTTAELQEQLFSHKEKYSQWTAYGALDKAERSKSLDIAGISKQLVFPSIAMSRFARSKDMKVVYGGTEALNRGMVDFCSDDERLLAVGYVSMRDPEQAQTSLKQAIEMGVKTVWTHSDAVGGRSPSHVDYDPLWAMMEEAGVPITLHIGSGVNMPPDYMNTGLDRILKPSLTNIETTRAKDVPVLHHSIERWLTCMIYDGVLERFPKLKIGLIELGANWLPAAMYNMDMGVRELGKRDVALQQLTLKPSEYVQRQVRATPFHMEDTGWILRNVGKDILMFNTDYPHPEGGSDPFGDFERSLDEVNATPDELDHFYSKNFEDYLNLN